MKLVKVTAAAALLGLAVGGYAIVQTHHSARMHHTNDPAMAEHLSKVFGQFAAFDVNKDGQLDAAERNALGKAIDDGSLILPAQAPGKDAFPSEDQRLNHFADMYARFAAYDANHDGALDSTEQAALQSAIDSGAFQFPGGGDANETHSHLHALMKSLHSR